MTLCLVTDRRRFDPPIQGLLSHIERAVDAGIDLVQIRERDMEAIDLVSLVTAALRITSGTRTRILVNDRLDVALACRADGVHLRSDSLSVRDARRIAPAGFLVSRSVHSTEEARSAAGADYLIGGTTFPSPSKPGAAALLGVDGLRQIVRAAEAPVLGIGGVTLDNVEAVARAGAAGVAAIGLFALPSLREIALEARRRFDTAKSAS